MCNSTIYIDLDYSNWRPDPSPSTILFMKISSLFACLGFTQITYEAIKKIKDTEWTLKNTLVNSLSPCSSNGPKSDKHSYKI
jgi:hypothetical protein